MSGAIKAAKRLVLFNHKGGVGKTTLTVNLAFALTELGKRVLLVDTDPQCSLSSFFLEEPYLDKVLDGSEDDDGQTIWSAVKPVSEGTGPLKQIDAVEIRENLYLAIGDIRLSTFESTLSDSWNLCISRNRRGYVCASAISSLVDRLVKRTKADFVFYDAGPNIGPLNRATLLDCTHFIVPAACDLFSSRALKTLGFALSEWVAAWERIRESAPDDSPLLEGKPELLGFVPQAFKVYRGEMTKSSMQVLARLDSRIVEFVWKPLQVSLGEATKEKPSDLKLGEIKYFGANVSESQTQGRSLWEITGGNASLKTDAKKVFRELAKSLIQRTS